MSDHDDPARALIDLAARPGAAETLVALHELAGTATLTQLRHVGLNEVSRVLPLLAVAGLITSRGTLDGFDANARVTLTSAGESVASTLVGLTIWMRRHRATSPRRPAWSRPFRLIWLYVQTLRYRSG